MFCSANNTSDDDDDYRCCRYESERTFNSAAGANVAAMKNEFVSLVSFCRRRTQNRQPLLIALPAAGRPRHAAAPRHSVEERANWARLCPRNCRWLFQATVAQLNCWPVGRHAQSASARHATTRRRASERPTTNCRSPPLVSPSTASGRRTRISPAGAKTTPRRRRLSGANQSVGAGRPLGGGVAPSGRAACLCRRRERAISRELLLPPLGATTCFGRLSQI